MVEFIIYIVLVSLIGIQIGLYLLLRQKRIPISQSLLFSFSILILPFMIISAHREIFKKRHLLLQVFSKKNKLNKKETESISKLIDTKRFLVMSIYFAVKDILTPKDNIILIVKIAELYSKKYVNQNQKKSLLERIGMLGLIKMATNVVKKYFVNHASDQMYIDNFKLKLS